MRRFDLDDDKIFLETDLFHAKCEIGFAVVGADGKPMERCQSSHIAGPGAVKSGCFAGGGSCSRALPQEKTEGGPARWSQTPKPLPSGRRLVLNLSEDVLTD